MKFYRIFILIVSLSNSLANNKYKNIRENINFENFENLLNSFHKNSYSNIEQSPSSLLLSSSSDDYYKNNKKFQHKIPEIIFDSPDDDIDYNNDNTMMNYGIKSHSPLIHSTNQRDISSQLSYKTHAHKTVFQSLCPTTSHIYILSDPDYEYRPDRYQNITCSYQATQSSSSSSSSSSTSSVQDKDDHNVCDQIGFRCVQHRRTMLLNVRKNGSECWKKESIIIDSGCECVMPV